MPDPEQRAFLVWRLTRALFGLVVTILFVLAWMGSTLGKAFFAWLLSPFKWLAAGSQP